MTAEAASQELDPTLMHRREIYDGLVAISDRMPVAHGREHVVALDTVQSYSDIGRPGLHVNQSLDVAIHASGELFGVIRAYDTEHDRTRYLLTRFDASADQPRAAIVGAIDEQPLEVGRTRLMQMMGLRDVASSMSRSHFSVAIVDGKLSVKVDPTTMNETEVLTRKEAQAPAKSNVVATAVSGLKKAIGLNKRSQQAAPVESWTPADFNVWSAPSAKVKGYLYLDQPARPASWDYTSRAEQHNPDLIYRGYPVIHRDSPIDGGVYVNFGHGRPITEATVVDSQSHTIYGELFDQVRQRAVDAKTGQITTKSMIDAVHNVISETMAYSMEGVNQLVQRLSGMGPLKPGRLVDLAHFLNAKVGVCRHQAVASALMIEMLIDQGLIRGKVSVDSNINWNATGFEVVGGHAWVRFEDGDTGEVYIIDVTQGYHGKLSETNTTDRWNYNRTTDTFEESNKAAFSGA